MYCSHMWTPDVFVSAGVAATIFIRTSTHLEKTFPIFAHVFASYTNAHSKHVHARQMFRLYLSVFALLSSSTIILHCVLLNLQTATR